jgi:hypothetical protein
MLANGAVAPGWTPGGTPVCAFAGDQGQVAIAGDGAGGAIVAWFDTRRGDPDHPDVYAGRVQGDGAVPTLPSFLRTVVEDGLVRVTWFAAGAGQLAIERSAGGAAWSRVATGSADGDGWLVYEDRDVAPGERYGYRLAGDSGTSFAEAWVDVPGRAFALAPPRANPARGALEASFTLPDGAPARLELIAASGRRVALREIGGLGAGTHRLDLAHGVTLPPGMYFVRLVRGNEAKVRRVVYLPE